MHPNHGITGAGDRALLLGLYLAEAALGLMVILIVNDLFVRNFIGIGLKFTTEYCGYLFVMFVFLGAPYSLRQGDFLRIELVGQRILQGLAGIYAVCAIVVSLIFLYEVGRLVLNSYSRQILAPTLTETPLWIPQLVLPIGMALMILALFLGLTEKKPPVESDADCIGREQI
jgi:TRAP-type C4-dicarboxylate transport system permease small subunit